MPDADVVVLGAGATGLGAARAARGAGARVVLVEADRPGGDCTWSGCVPSKTLLETARRVFAARSGEGYGFRAEVEVDAAAVMERVARTVAEIAEDESPELLARQGIELVGGWARFTSPTSVAVSSTRGGPAARTLTAERFVVATGTTATVPPPLVGTRPLTNATVFGLRELPEHLVVVGGGPVGVELGQAFRRLGARVTLVQRGPRLLPRDEPGAGAVVAQVLQAEGVDVRLGTGVEGADGAVLHLSDGTTVEGSHVLAAAGRTPSTADLDLARAGVALHPDGRVVVDDRLQAAPTVWAAGDCTSLLRFTHVGDEQGRLAGRNATSPRWGRGRWDDRVVPWVTFTDPEVARVGLSEAEALARHGDGVRVAVVPDTHNDRARTAGRTEGFVKLVAAPARVGGMLLGRLVGMTAVGPAAGEVVAEGALSMRAGTLVGRLAQTVHAYPTYALSTRIAAAMLLDRVPGARPARAGDATT